MTIKQQPARSLQWPLAVAHVIDFTGEQADVDGVVRGLGTEGAKFVVANLPVGAVLTGGFTTDDGNVDATVKFLLGSTDVTGTNGELAVRGKVAPGGENLVMEVTSGGTAGKMTLYLEYVVLGRSNEVQTH